MNDYPAEPVLKRARKLFHTQHLGRVKRKGFFFEMRKMHRFRFTPVVHQGLIRRHFLSIETFYSIKLFC